MSSAYNSTDKKSEDNCAKLAAALLKQYGLDINHLYTHTHWLNVRDGRNGTIDQLNTMYNRYKMCPAYILPHWAEFKKKVQSYLNAGTSTISAPSTKQIYRVRKSWASFAQLSSDFLSVELYAEDIMHSMAMVLLLPFPEPSAACQPLRL